MFKGRSTTHALTDMYHHWYSALDSDKSLRVLFVDFVKASDHVDHGTALNKLKNYAYDIHNYLSWTGYGRLSRSANRESKLLTSIPAGRLCVEECHKASGLGHLSFLSWLMSFVFNRLHTSTLTIRLGLSQKSWWRISLANCSQSLMSNWSATSHMNSHEYQRKKDERNHI